VSAYFDAVGERLLLMKERRRVLRLHVDARAVVMSAEEVWKVVEAESADTAALRAACHRLDKALDSYERATRWSLCIARLWRTP
jgi:hypothetical protein